MVVVFPTTCISFADLYIVRGDMQNNEELHVFQMMCWTWT